MSDEYGSYENKYFELRFCFNCNDLSEVKKSLKKYFNIDGFANFGYAFTLCCEYGDIGMAKWILSLDKKRNFMNVLILLNVLLCVVMNMDIWI